MPINASVHYFKAEQEYHEAQTKEQKLVALKKMLTTAPTHKGAEKLRKQIKERIAKLKYKNEKEAKLKAGSKSYSIKKEGAAQVVFVGLPNSGKSYVLEKLSGAAVERASYPFSTRDPVIRAILLDGAILQAIEIPSMYAGFYESDRGPELFSVVHNADFVVIVTDGRRDIEKDVFVILSEFAKADIALSSSEAASSREGFSAQIPAIVLSNYESRFEGQACGLELVNFKDETVSKINNLIWKKLRRIRVYTKTGSRVAEKPIVFKAGATVRDVTTKIHKDFLKKFKYAKIWGSGKFPGQQVGFDYKLADKDVVELYTG